VAVDDLQLGAAVGGERGEVGALARLCRLVVADDGGEVLHRDDGVVPTEPVYQRGNIEPQVTVLVAVAETVVEVEAVDVVLALLSTTPGVSSSGPTASRAREAVSLSRVD
jgi:hypothetical protein